MSDFNDALYAALKELNKRTNGDRIRSMTDEELADIIFYSPFMTKQDTLEWLKQEAADART